MRKLSLAIALGLAPLVGMAQTTVVTATVVDSDSVTWVNGTWQMDFATAGSTQVTSAYHLIPGGGALSPSVLHQNGVMDGGGNFSVTVYDSSLIAPSGSGWTLTVCPLASGPCGVYKFSTAGASMNVSANLTAIIPPPRFSPGANSRGYADIEAQVTLNQGAMYYNVLSQVQRIWNGVIWINGAGSGGTVNPGQLALAQYPSSLQSSVSPANFTYDAATGNNLTIPAAGSLISPLYNYTATGSVVTLSKPSTNVTNMWWNSCRMNFFEVDAKCGVSGLGYFGPYIRVVAANATQPANQDTYWGEEVQLDAVTGGINTSSQKSNFDAFTAFERSYTPGQHVAATMVMQNGSYGDTFGGASYAYAYGNTNAAGDEGHNGFKSYAHQGQGTTASEWAANISTISGNTLNYTGQTGNNPYGRGEGRLVIDTTTGVYSTGTITAISGTPPTITGSGTTWTSLTTGPYCFELDGGNATNAMLYALQVNSFTSDTSATLLNSNSNGNLAWAGDATTGTYKIYKCSTVTGVTGTNSITVNDPGQFNNGDSIRMPLGNALTTNGLAIVADHMIPGGTLTGLGIFTVSGSRKMDQAIAITANASTLIQHSIVSGAPATYTVFSDNGAPNTGFTFTGLTNQQFTFLSLNRAVSGGNYQVMYDPSTDLIRFLGAKITRFQAFDASNGRFDFDNNSGVPTLYVDAATAANTVWLNNGALLKGITGNQTGTTTINLSAATGNAIFNGTMQWGGGATLASSSGVTQTIANGTTAMTTASIAAVSGTTITCGATQTTSATGTATSDSIEIAASAAESSPNTGLVLRKWVTANNVNFAWCNPTASALTPVAETINWRVLR